MIAGGAPGGDLRSHYLVADLKLRTDCLDMLWLCRRLLARDIGVDPLRLYADRESNAV